MKTKNSKIAKKQNIYNSKGITLIALVVTIIVLIILAGVSINLLLGENGVITKAKEAKQQHEMAQVKEEIETAILEIETEEIIAGRNLTIDTLLEKLPIKLPGIIVAKEDDTLKGTYKDHDFVIDGNFKVTIDGYNPSNGGTDIPTDPDTPPTGSDTPSTDPEQLEIYTVAFNGTNATINVVSTIKEKETYSATLTPTAGYKVTNITIKMGETTLVENTDYTYTNGKIEIPSVSGNIQINVVATSKASLLKAGDYIKYNTGVASVGENGIITCRVLYEANSEYGLQIISDKNVANVTLGVKDNWSASRDAYNSAIVTLNDEAEKYLNAAYAIDARCVGSVPTINSNGTFIEKDTENAGPVKLKFSSSVSGANNMKAADTNYTTDRTQMESKNIWTTGERYWLASRDVDSGSSVCYFNVRYVYTSGDLRYDGLCYVTSGGNAYGDLDSPAYGLRPCFSLKSDINITGGNGTSDSPYTM